MKNFENPIDNENEKITLPVTVITTTPDILPHKEHIKKSIHDLKFDSRQDYSSRVWDAVKADMQDHIEGF